MFLYIPYIYEENVSALFSPPGNARAAIKTQFRISFTLRPEIRVERTKIKNLQCKLNMIKNHIMGEYWCPKYILKILH